MATHRDCKLGSWSATHALVRFYEGEYADVTDPVTGETSREYERGPIVETRLYAFDGDCTYERLTAFLEDELSRFGTLPSIPEQEKQREAELVAIGVESL